MKIGDEVYIHGYIDEIRKDTIIIKNNGGYFGTILDEIDYKSFNNIRCKDCKYFQCEEEYCSFHEMGMYSEDYCSYWESPEELETCETCRHYGKNIKRCLLNKCDYKSI